jgi:hypothetical protein
MFTDIKVMKKYVATQFDTLGDFDFSSRDI